MNTGRCTRSDWSEYMVRYSKSIRETHRTYHSDTWGEMDTQVDRPGAMQFMDELMKVELDACEGIQEMRERCVNALGGPNEFAILQAKTYFNESDAFCVNTELFWNEDVIRKLRDNMSLWQKIRIFFS